MSWHIAAAGKGQKLVEAIETQALAAHSYSGEPGRSVIDAHVLSVRAIVAVYPERGLNVVSSGHVDAHSVSTKLDISGLNLVE